MTAGTRAALPGYVCVVSRIHVVEPFELRDDARHAFWEDVSAVAEAVRRTTGSTKMNYEIHGNTIPHLHVHLYPRYPGDPFEGRPIDGRETAFGRSIDDLAALRNAMARGPGDAGRPASGPIPDGRQEAV